MWTRIKRAFAPMRWNPLQPHIDVEYEMWYLNTKRNWEMRVEKRE